jgi:hypothetical protein
MNIVILNWGCNKYMHGNTQVNSLCSYIYLKLAKMSCFSLCLLCFFFYKIGELEDRTCLPWGAGYLGGDAGGKGRWQGKGVGR